MKTRILTGILLLTISALVSSCEEEIKYTIHEGEILSSITTGDATVTAVSAVLNGAVSGLSEQATAAYTVGFYYSTLQDPKNGTRITGSSDAGNSTFNASVGGLTKGVTYYYCAFVALQNKVFYYGDVKSFTTTDAMIATADAAAITSVSATLGGTLGGVTELVGNSSLSYGVLLGTSNSAEVLQDGKAFVGNTTSNTYNIVVIDLVPGVTYYYMAYMDLDGIRQYGELKSFTTESVEMEYVDMGLSVAWASYNIGATRPEEVGGLYGWGDISGVNTSTNIADYGMNADIVAGEFDICAASGLGRLPTFAEINDLVTKCTSEWTEINGVSGYKFTARNGNSIFLPAAGTRTGYSTSSEGVLGGYWSGSNYKPNTDYAYTMQFNSGGVAWGTSQRFKGLSIRPVQEMKQEGIPFDNYKLVTGDIEGNGNYRIDIYNAWDGSGTDTNCGLDPAAIAFTDQISVTFTLSGITTPGEYQAFMVFADGTWTTQNWGYNDNGQGSVLVTGDGTYTVKLDGAGAGLGVFAIDVVGLSGANGGAEGITTTINNIFVDNWGTIVPFDNYKLNAGDVEGNGNYRMEIYNAYGVTANNCGLGVAPADFAFATKMAVTFTISGISVPGEYQTFLAFADGSWATSNWDYNADGQASTIVTGDGTYTVKLTGAGSGLNVFCIDIKGLTTALGSADGVLATIDAIRIE
ncbi:MAG: hypothetical protein LBM62_07385 [Mediterranea sp.]|nr:hypothetical protein [Mediterranea sp.]